MRVLAMTHSYLPTHCAGAETMMHGMLRALVAAGHEASVVLSTQRGEPYEVDGIAVYPRTTQKDFLARILDCDVVVAHLANTPPAAAMGKWNRKPVVILLHNDFSTHFKVVVAPQGHVSVAVANSQWVADAFVAWSGRQRRTAHIPPVIVHRPVVHAADHATTPGDRVTLVNLSQDVPGGPDGVTTGKGGELFRRLAERMPDTSFLGVTGSYGPQQDMAGLPNVDVLPHVAHGDMREKVWARTRVLLMPSAYESWGRTAAEALCSGIPVIAHPTQGLRENLGDAGIFIDRNDTDAWARALRDLQDPAAYEAASKVALARSEEHQRMSVEDEARWCETVAGLVA